MSHMYLHTRIVSKSSIVDPKMQPLRVQDGSKDDCECVDHSVPLAVASDSLGDEPRHGLPLSRLLDQEWFPFRNVMHISQEQGHRKHLRGIRGLH